MAVPGPVYFTDENVLGLGKLLRRAGRDDVVYPGHEALPEVPVGTPDLDWMPVIGRRGLVVLTRDRRIRTRPAELRAYWDHGIRSVWIGRSETLGRTSSSSCSSGTKRGCGARSPSAGPVHGPSR